MNRAIAGAATFAIELITFAAALFLTVALEAWLPVVGLSRGNIPMYLALGLSFFGAGFVRFPWPRRAWQVGVASLVVGLVVLGVLVWNYQSGMRFNPQAWRFRLEYLVSGANLGTGAIGCVAALTGFFSADRLTLAIRRNTASSGAA